MTARHSRSGSSPFPLIPTTKTNQSHLSNSQVHSFRTCVELGLTLTLLPWFLPQVGVAVRQELGDKGPHRKFLPQNYVIAEALDASPCSSVGGASPPVPTSPTQRLSEAAIAHWAACLTFLARRARAQDIRDAAERKVREALSFPAYHQDSLSGGRSELGDAEAC